MSELEEVYTNSPKGNSLCETPLQSYLRDRKILQHKKLADERKRLLTQAQAELDVALCQNDCLTSENGKLKNDVSKLKIQLEDMKSKLFAMPDDDLKSDENELEELRAYNRQLRYSIAEQRDTEKYSKDLETRLEKELNENRRLEHRLTSIQEKLTEVSTEKNSLAIQVVELTESMRGFESENEMLREAVKDLQQELECLKEIKQQSTARRLPSCFGNDSLNISIDNPEVSPSTSFTNIGRDINMDLRDEISRLNDELKKEKELRLLEVEKSEFLVKRVTELEEECDRKKVEHEEALRAVKCEMEKLKYNLDKDLSAEKDKLTLEVEKNHCLTLKISILEEKNREFEREGSENLKRLREECESKIEAMKIKHENEIDHFEKELALSRQGSDEEQKHLSSRVAELESRVQVLESVKAELSLKNEEYARMINEKQLEVTSVEETFKEQMRQEEERLQNLTRKLEESQRHSQITQERLRSEFDKEVNGLKSRELQLLSKISDLEKDKSSFKERYNKVDSSLNDLASELEEYKMSLQDAFRQIQEQEKAQALANETEAALRDELGKLKTENDSLLTELKATEDRLREVSDSHSKELHQHDLELDEKLKEISESNEKKISDVVSEFAKYRTDLEESYKVLRKNAEAQETKARATEAELRNEIEKLSTEKKSLLADLTALETEHTEKLKRELEDKVSEVRMSYEKRILELEDELSHKTESSVKPELEDALANQKQRYEERLKKIVSDVNAQYKSKLAECISSWEKRVDDKKQKITELQNELQLSEADRESLTKENQRMTEKYDLAKKKCVQLCDDFDAERSSINKELQQAQAKYQAAKKAVLQERERYKTFEAQLASLRSLNEQLRKELSDAKLQKQVDKKDADGFKLPTSVSTSTPGRSRVGRTQSEASMPRRPPPGAGSLFPNHEEMGEVFSSSYLNDLKQGRCSVGSSNRASELSRRNSMVPPHLKSSYPAETQFVSPKKFTDDDLKESRISFAPGSPLTSSANIDSRRQSLRQQSKVNMKRKEISDDCPTPKKSSRNLVEADIENSVNTTPSVSNTPRFKGTPASLKKIFSRGLFSKKGLGKGNTPTRRSPRFLK